MQQHARPASLQAVLIYQQFKNEAFKKSYRNCLKKRTYPAIFSMPEQTRNIFSEKNVNIYGRDEFLISLHENKF